MNRLHIFIFISPFLLFPIESWSQCGTIQVSPAAPLCRGEAILFIAEADTFANLSPQFWWDFGDGSAPEMGDSLYHTFSSGGTYGVTLSILAGTDTCLVQQNVSIDSVAPLVVSAINDCFDSYLLVSLAQGQLGGYIWSWGDGTTSSSYFNDPTASQSNAHFYSNYGTFILTITRVGESCPAYTQTVYNQPTINNVPFSPRDASNCVGSTVWLDLDYSTVSHLNYLSHLVVFWNDGQQDTIPAFQDSVSHVYSALPPPTDTSISIVAYNVCGEPGNSSFAGITLTQANAVFSLSQDTLCLGSPFQLQAQASLGSQSYLWDLGDGSPVQTGPAIQHSYGMAGPFMVSLTATDSIGCISAQSALVEVIPAFSPVIHSPDSAGICGGGSTTFRVDSLSLPAGFPVSYLWDFASAGTSTLVMPTTFFAEGNQDTSYHFSTQVRMGGCNVLVADSIMVYYTPDLSVYTHKPKRQVCTSKVDEPLMKGPSSPGTTWVWSGQGVIELNGDYFFQPNLPAGDYPLTLTYTTPHCTEVIVDTIEVLALPDAQFSYQQGIPTPINGPGANGPNSTVAFQGPPLASSYDWDFGDGQSGTGVNPLHTYSIDDTFTVSLIVVGPNGCRDTSQEIVVILGGQLASVATFQLSGPQLQQGPIVVEVLFQYTGQGNFEGYARHELTYPDSSLSLILPQKGAYQVRYWKKLSDYEQTHLIPTYYSGQFDPQFAQIFQLNAQSLRIQDSLIEGASFIPESTQLLGTLTFRRTPMIDHDLIILDLDSIPLLYTRTNQVGKFSIVDLPCGGYLIRVCNEAGISYYFTVNPCDASAEDLVINLGSTSPPDEFDPTCSNSFDLFTEGDQTGLILHTEVELGISVTNLHGQRIYTEHKTRRQAGSHLIPIPDLPGNVYLITLSLEKQTQSCSQTRKLIRP